jgi:DNA-binding MarR family transcriptional regulator
MATHRLQRGWFDLLAPLRRAGAPFELTPTELMHATMLSSGGVTKRLDRLEAAGLVGRRPDPSDRRGTLVRLTRRGKAAIDAAIVSHVANEDRLLDVLTMAERATLDRVLRKLMASMEPELDGGG